MFQHEKETVKFIQIFQIYCHYFSLALQEIYLYYVSPFPLYVFLRRLALANRKIRVLWPAKSRGRKPLDQKIIDLILELKKLNPRWGAQKISDELMKIGHKVSKKTVLKYLEVYRAITPSPSKTLSWTEFLDNHKFKIGIDFTSLITVQGYQVFIFVILDLDTRKLLYINTTFQPFASWITQQFRNAFFDLDETPSLCICDRDAIFSGWFIKMMNDYFDIKVKQTPIKSPQKNCRVERFHLSLKTEAFQNVVPINLDQTTRICRQYQKYYNENRPHQGIAGKIPTKLQNTVHEKIITFERKKHLGGKIISLEPIKSLVA